MLNKIKEYIEATWPHDPKYSQSMFKSFAENIASGGEYWGRMPASLEGDGDIYTDGTITFRMDCVGNARFEAFGEALEVSARFTDRWKNKVVVSDANGDIIIC